MITDEKLKKLRELAEDATQGDWFDVEVRGWLRVRTNNGDIEICVCGDEEEEQSWKNAKYIAAVNPQTVLELLDEIERLKGERHFDSGTLSEQAEIIRRLQRQIKELERERDEVQADLAFLQREYGESDEPMTEDAKKLKERLQMLKEIEKIVDSLTQAGVMKCALEKIYKITDCIVSDKYDDSRLSYWEIHDIAKQTLDVLEKGE